MNRRLLVKAGERAVMRARQQGINMGPYGQTIVDFLRHNRIGVGDSLPHGCRNAPTVRIGEGNSNDIWLYVLYPKVGKPISWSRLVYGTVICTRARFLLGQMKPEKPHDYLRKRFRAFVLPMIEATREIKSRIASSYYKEGLPGLFAAIEENLSGKPRLKAHAALILYLLPDQYDYPLLRCALYTNCSALRHLIGIERHNMILASSSLME